MHVRTAYEIWAMHMSKKPFSATEFGGALTKAVEALGGSKRKFGGMGIHYFGCKLTPAWAHRVAMHYESKGQAKLPSPVKNGEKFLGETSLLNDSGIEVEIRA
jgi:hypothetical protein